VCASGRIDKNVSSEVIVTFLYALMAFVVRFLCESMTPLECPVVPDV